MLVVNQFSVAGTKQARRPDVVVFVNGLPLAVVELKNPADASADAWKAYSQLQTYKDEISGLLAYNVALVISDGTTAQVGSLTANKERFMSWRYIKNEDDSTLLEYQLEKVVRGFFNPELFLDYMRYFVLFEDDGDSLIKKIAGYHQFHGVREAVRGPFHGFDYSGLGLFPSQFVPSLLLNGEPWSEALKDRFSGQLP